MFLNGSIYISISIKKEKKLVNYVNNKMDRNIKNLIGWWKLKGETEDDPFIRFFFFYICFDAWITTLSGEEIDTKKIRWFLENDNCLKHSRMGFWNSTQTQSLLNNLKQYSPVFDMRRNHKGQDTKLNDINNLEEVIKFIYQIRCNLFHGSKDPMNDRDKGLVELSGLLLKKWIVWAYEECGKEKSVPYQPPRS